VSAAWNPNQTFTVGAATDTTSNTDTVTGTGDYQIAIVGQATVNLNINNVTVNGVDKGSSITAGSGADTISITGDGDNVIQASAGSTYVSINGVGDNIFRGNLTGSASISGLGGILEITGSFNGPATIGPGARLQLDGPSLGSLITPITLAAGSGGDSSN
jgi:hypothetical protein